MMNERYMASPRIANRYVGVSHRPMPLIHTESDRLRGHRDGGVGAGLSIACLAPPTQRPTLRQWGLSRRQSTGERTKLAGWGFQMRRTRERPLLRLRLGALWGGLEALWGRWTGDPPHMLGSSPAVPPLCLLVTRRRVVHLRVSARHHTEIVALRFSPTAHSTVMATRCHPLRPPLLKLRPLLPLSSMTSLLFSLLFLLILTPPLSADVYLHSPRGSNNRLNEQSATRANNNRLFDSQNNARGGYNVGDRIATPFSPAAPRAYAGIAPAVADLTNEFDPTQTTASQYSLVYLEGSHLHVEWTNQHGCGGNEATDPQKLNCDLILQYACETGGDDGEYNSAVIRGAESLRDGATTGTFTGTPPVQSYTSPITPAYLEGDLDAFGRHESKNFYYECSQRSRNKGLFLADQQLGGNSAVFTRQNNNGQRFGLECPEERDYYPYWSPSPWKDIAVLTDHTLDQCDSNGYYTGASQNNHLVYRCIPSPSTAPGSAQYQAAWAAITSSACSSAQGTWQNYTHNLPPPVCMQAEWTRVNHLGNGRQGDTLSFDWTIPSIANLTAAGVNLVGGVTSYARCVLRLRYNISTDDFSTSTTDYRFNGAANSPVTTNMQIDIGAPLGVKLPLQLNTAQLARTFQDRSHVFFIATRPAAMANRTVHNLNVRGKRCNIVECYPAVSATPYHSLSHPPAGYS